MLELALLFASSGPVVLIAFAVGLAMLAFARSTGRQA